MVFRQPFTSIFAISYLSSGKSHVPYLWNNPNNPINMVIPVTFTLTSRVTGLHWTFMNLIHMTTGRNHLSHGPNLYILKRRRMRCPQVPLMRRSEEHTS